MIEIIVLILLCIQNKKLAIKKGLKPTPWIFYTIGTWLMIEMIGIFLGIFILGITLDNIFALTCIGLMSGFGGYLIVRAILEKKPDFEEENIDRIGVDDLQPPKN
jgi:hypothetical protein